MYQALYRKWRSKDFDDVCGQSQVTDILKYQVANNRTSHAYLFCGSRGTGKTSCAKILAKAVNCLSPVNGNPCRTCESCRAIDTGAAVDVIEMDAASNNSVDNVRDMKEEISFTPAELRYRVYIIDEVHMMSASAFNALLKTLEEPPSHVIFILATTELQKLPATIISRCQRFDFRRISASVIVERLKHISQKEGIELTDAGARLIARLSQGGMRDAVSLLELCASARKPISAELVCELVGVTNRETVYDVIEAIAEKDYTKIYDTVRSVVNSASDITVWWSDLCDAYRDLMVVKVLESAKEYLDLTDHEYDRLKKLTDILPMPVLVYHNKLLSDTMQLLQRQGISKRTTAEMALSRMCDPRLSKEPESLLARIDELEKEVSRLRMLRAADSTSANSLKNTEDRSGQNLEAPTSVSPQKKSGPQHRASGQVAGWQDIIEKFELIKPNFVGVFRNANAEFDENGALKISMPKSFRVGILEKDRETLTMFLSLVAQANPAFDIRSGMNIKDTTTVNQNDSFEF